MNQDYNSPLKPEDQEQLVPYLNEPSYENELVNAKAFLQKCSPFSGDNLYDHLTYILNKILAERPENVIDFFEEYSKNVKERKFEAQTDHFDDMFVPPGRFDLANKILPLLKPVRGKRTTMDPDDLNLADISNNDMLQLLFYFEQAGLGLPKTEMLYITISVKQLIYNEPIATIRFWGKIFGINRNYLIFETELKDEAYVKKNQQYQEFIYGNEVVHKTTKEDIEEVLQQLALDDIRGEGLSPRLQITFPPIPNLDYQEPLEPPPEPSGVGLNKKVYYVCNKIGDEWVQLPDVNPKQIRVARQIYKKCTGDLNHEINTYPEFPGNESNYLRAQIARISSSTHISPLGFYTFISEGEEGEGGDDEELNEEAEDDSKTTYNENPKYDPVPIKDLLDPAMLFWIHHAPYILPQGRTTWWNPSPLPEPDDEIDEADGEEEKEENKPKGPFVEPETGPSLLTPCSEDIALNGMSPWSVRSSSTIIDDFALAVAKSNYWPGAYCLVTQGKLFQNVYLGEGNKYKQENFSPVPLPDVEQDYPIGPEIMEITDPTGAQEKEWRIAHLPEITHLRELNGEGEELGGEEEDEDEEDDDDDD